MPQGMGCPVSTHGIKPGRYRRLGGSAVLALAFSFSGLRDAHGQEPENTPAAAASTVASGTSGGAASAQVQLPSSPTIDDPMLEPAPRAARNLANLGEALGFVRERSTDLGRAEAEVRRAAAATRTALAALLPTITGNGSATHHFFVHTTNIFASGTSGGNTGEVPVRTTKTPQTDYVNGSITLVQPLIHVQDWHDYGTARHSEGASLATLEDTRRTLIQGVTTAIIGVVAAERVAEINRIGLRSALERLVLTQKKRELGAATGLDVVRVEQDVATARATLVSGDESLRKARESLGLALGVPEAVGVVEGFALNGLIEEAEKTCPRIKEIRERFDYVALERKLDVAERNIHSVELSFLPTLNAQSTLATTSSDTGTTPRTTWNVQAILTVPIWDGGARYGSLRSARALRDEAALDLEAKRRSGSMEVTQAQRAIRVAEEALAVAKEAERLAVDADRLTQASYKVGQSTSLELITAASAARQAEVTFVLREFDLVSAKVSALMVLSQCSR